MSTLHGASPARALTAWIDALREAGGMQPLPAEEVELARATGRVTAIPAIARASSPGFDAAAMDGIAVAAADTSAAPLTLPRGAFHDVDTGDRLPDLTDAVVRREDVADGATLERRVAPWTNVRQVGEDVAAGELLLRAGHVLRPADLAVLASVGETAVSVRRRPRVAIVPSGDELVPPGSDPRPGEIIDTNSLMLAALVEEAGGDAECFEIVPDDAELLSAALARAVAGADLVLLVAGSARGAGDHAVTVIERGGRVVARGVAVRPGHPVVLGLTGPTPLVGVPGYPVSAALAFELFAAPVLAELGGHPIPPRPRARATAAVEIRSTPGSEEWVRLRLTLVGGRLLATALRRGAGVLSSLARADALVCIPAGESLIPVGREVEVELLRPLAAIERSLVVAGATDPMLEPLAGRLDLVADCNGSANGALALAAGTCHAALLAGEDVPVGAVILQTWERTLGLIVRNGDPLRIGADGGLATAGVRLANRQPGSSARRLLDRVLAEQSIDPTSVAGYTREARSDTAAAAAVAAGVADCAPGTRAAAALHGLGFVPLTTETLTLVVASSLADDVRIVRLRAALEREVGAAQARR